MRKKNRLIPFFATAGLLLGGLGIAIAITASLRSFDNTELVRDDTKLYLGVPLKCGSMPVTLKVTARSANVTETKEFSSVDLDVLDGQPRKAVFLDYAGNPVVDLNGKSVGYWLDDPQNKITVTVTAKDVVESAEVEIDKAGIWFVDAPESPGAKPTVKYASYYKEVAKGGLA